MGALISLRSSKQSTVQILEGIEKDFQILNDNSKKYQRQLKRWGERLLLYSFLLFMMTFMVVYFLFLPEQLMGRFILSLPFIIFPFLVWLIRKLLVVVFTRRTKRNNGNLESLKYFQSKKKKVFNAKKNK
uniref:Lunapark n=1 Tax=Gouania willdenowi TaxID=441366 RepID=A0A8C5HB31_GOUWI